ncbi:MAG: phosphodiester glycosidase family protein [Actinomycetota bacterium]
MTKKTLAPGVVYQQINDTAIPARLYVLTFDAGTAATLDDVLSSSQIGTFQRTSYMGTNVGALAAVNGDLNDWPARPTHQYVQDGTVVQTGSRPGYSFGFRRDERGATIGYHPLRISATDNTLKTTVAVSSWNTDAPATDQVVGYSWYGGKYAKPAANQCSARLATPTALRWNTNENGAGRDYKVESVRCSSTTATTVNSGTVVLSAKMIGKGATFIKGLKVGATVHIGWTNDSPGAMDIVSGSALILKGGVLQYASKCRLDLCQRNPRTVAGVTATGKVILLVVDGRSSGSIGLTLYELGQQMKALGAVDAVNLDGGGSATMWIKGLGVVNHPTDSTGERPVSNGIVILPGADTAEASPLAARAGF